MTPQRLAQIHAAAFVDDRPWTAAEFEALMASPFVAVFTQPDGFALTRLIVDEAELLTIAVAPAVQGQGTGRRLLTAWLDQLVAAQARTAFLEVAADNLGALHLYTSLGFQVSARRRGYYQRKDAAAVDALVLSREVTHSHFPVSPPKG
tara:strand:- start:10 stop:456 length:447 start_codon:yes stop_codon:yes gene_type:complete